LFDSSVTNLAFLKNWFLLTRQSTIICATIIRQLDSTLIRLTLLRLSFVDMSLQVKRSCSVCTFLNRGNTRRARSKAYNGNAWVITPCVGRVPNTTFALNRMSLNDWGFQIRQWITYDFQFGYLCSSERVINFIDVL
jgi:hypothetical protein